VLVADAYNPSYSRGRGQEACCLKPPWENSSQDPVSKIPITKRLMEWLKVKALSSSPRIAKKKFFLMIS
jgi:hypothetical protein